MKTIIGPRGDAGRDGDNGKNAYELAKDFGYFAGPLDEWLKSLIGPKGEKGDPGQNGTNGEQGSIGLQGLRGISGPMGEKGDQGLRGDRGPKGDRGDIGPMPEHEWKGTELRFELAPGVWGEYVDLQGPQGKRGPAGGGGGVVQSTTTQNTYFPSGW